MREKNEVIMIYADSNYKDLGVLQDYSFDECYGLDENNFECKIQKYNPVLWDENDPIGQDFILYIEFTEYGGIIDRIESDTKNGVVTLSGRSWHGFINSFVIEPYKGQDTRTYSGEGNDVIRAMLSDAGFPSNLYEVSTEDSEVVVTSTTVRYEKAYDAIIRVLTANQGKLIMYYQNGKLHMEAALSINTGAFDEFDTSQVPLKVGKTYNNVNDLICMGQGNGSKRAVIHLYVRNPDEASDNDINILPYCRSNPKQDSDYYTDLSKLAQSTNPEDIANYADIMSGMVTGKAKYTEIYDYPNAEITYNYLKLTTKPANWAGVYTNYYTRNASDSNTFEKVEKVYKYEYYLTENLYGGAPPDWKTNYKKYYQKATNSATELTAVQDLPIEQSHIEYRPNTEKDGYEGYQTIDAQEWAKNYSAYYEKVPTMSSFEWRKVQGVQNTTYKLYEGTTPPLNWNTNYGDYYYKRTDGVTTYYERIAGVPKTKNKLQTSKPTDWASNYGSYYFKAKTEKKDTSGKIVMKKGKYYTVSQGISWKVIEGYYYDKPKKKQGKHNYPKWSKNTFYTRYTTYNAPTFETNKVYYQVTTTVAPTFVANKYYSQIVDSAPTWQKKQDGANAFGGYYEESKNTIEQIPVFEEGDFYEMKEDRYKVLIENALKKLSDLSDKDSLDIDLELDSAYDIGDWICGMDSVTGTTMLDTTKMIRRKIIKIKKGILSIDYEVE